MKIDFKYLVLALAILFLAGIVNGEVSQFSENQNTTLDLDKAVNTPNSAYTINTANNDMIITWAKGYTLTSNSSIARSVIQTSNGNYIVGGACYSGSCVNLMMLNAKGNILWQKNYAIVSSPISMVMKQTSDNGSIFASQNTVCKKVGRCTSIVKVDSIGNIQWENDLSYSSQVPSTIPVDIQQTIDGGYVVAGYANGSTGNYSTWVAKLDSSGNIQWQRLFFNSNINEAAAIRQTPDGGYVIAGSTLTNSVYRILVVNLDPTGNLIWQRTYTTNYGSFATSIELTPDGGYLVGGDVYTISYFPAILLKLDSKGNVQWSKTYSDSAAGIHLNSIIQTSDKGFALSGLIYNGKEKAWIAKINASGIIQWQNTYGAENADRMFDNINQTRDGGFVASGATNQFNGKFDSWIVKVDPNGNIANCADIQASSATPSSVVMTTALGGLTLSNNSFAYNPDVSATIPGSYTPIKECQ